MGNDILFIQFQKAVESMAYHVMVTDVQGVIIYINPAFERTTGFTKDYAIGRTPAILKSGEQPREYYRLLWETILSGREFSAIVKNKKKDGTLYYAEQLVTPLKDEAGRVTHFISTWADVTARMEWEARLEKSNEEYKIQSWGLEKANRAIKTLYKELEKQNEELKKLDQLKSDFVSTVSHELRTPLAISTEGINLILDGLVDDITDKQRKILEASKENLTRLNMIINDLLDISKIESGKIDLYPSLLDIISHVKGIIASYQPVAAKKNLQLEMVCPSERIMLYADMNKITQVIINFLNNATKFTAEGGKITVSLAVDGMDVVCGIQDSGVGIEKENLGKLFKKFQQIGRQEGPGIKGTGLGLVISKNLVELHGGRVWVESEVGVGTTFYFSLPLYQKVQADFNQLFARFLSEAQARKNSLGVLMIQLGNAENIRVKSGEQALTDIMNALLSSLTDVFSNQNDKVHLYGPDRLCVLLPEITLQGISSVVNRIKKRVKTKRPGANNGLNLDIKFGHAIYPDSALTRDGLVQAAMDDIGRQKSILVVDDHPQIFRILRSRLQAFGYHVDSAMSGEDALAAMDKKRPDLVILDIMMPGMNGYEVFGRMKENSEWSSIPIIILTAKNVDSVKQEAPEIGEIPVLTKTGSFHSLVELIQAML